MPVMAPQAPQLTKPWNTCVSTPTISATSSDRAGDMLGRIAQRLGAAELLEADEMGKLAAQFEEQLGPGLEAVIGAVVDDRRQVDRGLEHAGEMAALGRRRRAARQHARDDHQPPRAVLLACAASAAALLGVLRARADDDRQAGARRAARRPPSAASSVSSGQSPIEPQ